MVNKMTTRIIFAGSGGQGIQFSGKQMAKMGMHVDKNVTFLPSYGPEMRGGTSNCTVSSPTMKSVPPAYLPPISRLL